MLAIARGMMSKPGILLLDEPSLGLAPILVERIFDMITEINKKGTTVLLVEQNANIALHVASYGYIIETGKITVGDTTEVLVITSYSIHYTNLYDMRKNISQKLMI